MKNVTITLTEETAQWARIYATRHHSSVSKLVGELLRQKMLEEEGYNAAMKQFLSVRPKKLKQAGSYPSRKSLHER